MFSGTAAPKRALSRASAFDHQANHIGVVFEPQITQISQIKGIMYVVLLISQKDYELW